MADLNDDNFHACIASGGGRMTITMDRYEANWAMVEQGWHVHVLGEVENSPVQEKLSKLIVMKQVLLTRIFQDL